MSPQQAFGMLLLALGIAIYSFITQLWSKSRKDPRWILRGEIRELVGPGTAHVINALLLVVGALTGAAAFARGLLLFQWI